MWIWAVIALKWGSGQVCIAELTMLLTNPFTH